MFDNEEDYDFTPSNGSKLASLFGSPMMNGDDVNKSLTYTAPKQPKQNKPAEATENESSTSKLQSVVLFVKVVTVWKLENTKYNQLGKHGFGIIGSTAHKAYELIMYKEKTNIIVKVPVNDAFSLLNQDDNFSTFYDTSGQNWLLKFDSAEEQNEFASKFESYGGKVVINSKNQPQKEENVPKAELEAKGVDLQTRADILSRITKMGQQILPQTAARANTSTDISDSDVDESRSVEIVKPAPRKFKKPVQSSEMQQQIVGVNSQSQMVPNVLFNYDGLGVLVAQNTELKMNLSQMNAKLDAVLTKSASQDDSSSGSNLKSKMKALQLQVENLQSEVRVWQGKYEELHQNYLAVQNEVVEDPMVAFLREQQVERIMELSFRLEEEESKCQLQEEELARYRCEASKLHNFLGEDCEDVSDRILAKLKEAKENVKALVNTVEIQNLKLKDFEEFYESNKDNKNLLEEIKVLNGTVDNLKLKLKDFEEYHEKNQDNKSNALDVEKERYNQINDLIKEHMNNMYQSLINSFDSEVAYTAADIQANISRSIKSSTYKVIADLKDVCLSGNNLSS